MPLKVVCKNCGYVLYDDKNVVPIITIVNKYRGRCPKCKHRLASHHVLMKVTPADPRLMRYMQKQPKVK